MFLNVLLLLVVLLGGTGEASSSSSSCSYQSGCVIGLNRDSRVEHFGEFYDDDDVSITFRQTPNFPATMRDSVEKGVELAQSFLGKVSDVDVFMYEAQNASAQNPSAYEEQRSVVRGDADEVHGYCNDGAGKLEKAMNGENNVFASGEDDVRALRRTGEEEYADCHHARVGFVGRVLRARHGLAYSRSHPRILARFQTLFGAHTPAWLMEGGAVQLEAVFSNHASRGTYRKTYEDHFKHTIFPAEAISFVRKYAGGHVVDDLRVRSRV